MLGQTLPVIAITISEGLLLTAFFLSGYKESLKLFFKVNFLIATCFANRIVDFFEGTHVNFSSNYFIFTLISYYVMVMKWGRGYATNAIRSVTYMTGLAVIAVAPLIYFDLSEISDPDGESLDSIILRQSDIAVLSFFSMLIGIFAVDRLAHWFNESKTFMSSTWFKFPASIFLANLVNSVLFYLLSSRTAFPVSLISEIFFVGQLYKLNLLLLITPLIVWFKTKCDPAVVNKWEY